MEHFLLATSSVCTNSSLHIKKKPFNREQFRYFQNFFSTAPEVFFRLLLKGKESGLSLLDVIQFTFLLSASLDAFFFCADSRKQRDPKKGEAEESDFEIR